FKKALEYGHKSLEIMTNESETRTLDLVDLYKVMGSLYVKMESPNQAIEYLNKGLEIGRKSWGDFNANFAPVYNYLGLAYSRKTDFSQAILYAKRALQIQQKMLGTYHIRTVVSYLNIGGYHTLQGNREKALKYLQEGLRIGLKTFQKPNTVLVKTYGHLGAEYERQYDFDKSLVCYNKSIELQLQVMGEHHYDTIILYKSVGSYYSNIQDHVSALQYWEKALKIAKNLLGEKHVITTLIYFSKAKHFFQRNDFEQALQCFQKSCISVCFEYSNLNFYDSPSFEETYNILILFKILNRKALCLHAFVNLQGEDRQGMEAVLETYQLAMQTMIHVRQSFRTNEAKFDLIKSANSLFEGGMKASKALSLSESMYNFGEQAKANLLLSSMQDSLAKIASKIPKALLQKEKSLQIQLTFLDKTIQKEEAKNEKKDTETLKESQNAFFEHHQKYAQLIEELEQDYPDYYQLKYETKTASIEEIQKSLSENQVMVSYFVGETHFYIFLITPDLFEILDYDKPDDFEELIEAFLQAIQQHQLETYCQTAFRLHRLLMKEVEAFLIDPFADNNIFGEEDDDATNNKQLIIIPHGILNYVPFEALLCSDATSIIEGLDVNENPYHHLDYLLLHCEISYHYSATLWHYLLTTRGGRAAINNDFVGFAPVYQLDNKEKQEAFVEAAKEVGEWATRSEALRRDGTWTPLPHSKVETENIAGLFADEGLEAQVFLNEKATKERFRKMAEKSRFLLIAAHGVVNDKHPKLSGLVFFPTIDESRIPNIEPPISNNESQTSDYEPPITKRQTDCILSMEETYHLNLQADLVVLSSCESGIGTLAKGEGMMAVNRGFLYAGAKNVVSTLFKVYDKPSGLLTQYLFEGILERKDYTAALREAKLRLLKMEKVDVKSWCGFVLIGGE
ncbi:MAG: CHAT domain-containing protein, partial [Chitinophagales bacterium]